MLPLRTGMPHFQPFVLETQFSQDTVKKNPSPSYLISCRQGRPHQHTMLMRKYSLNQLLFIAQY